MGQRRRGLTRHVLEAAVAPSRDASQGEADSIPSFGREYFDFVYEVSVKSCPRARESGGHLSEVSQRATGRGGF